MELYKNGELIPWQSCKAQILKHLSNSKETNRFDRLFSILDNHEKNHGQITMKMYLKEETLSIAAYRDLDQPRDQLRPLLVFNAKLKLS